MISLKGKKRNDLVIYKTKYELTSFQGKNVVVVGGTNGLGRAIAKNIADKGGRVTVVGRTFRDQGVNNFKFVEADFKSLRAAEKIANRIAFEQVDYLILTTGVFSSFFKKETNEGVELDLAVSYLSRYMLMDHVADRIGVSRQGKAKVFVMGFPGMNLKANISDLNSEDNYNAGTAHNNTVIGNEALVHQYSKSHKNFHCFGLNPGLIKSDIRKGLTGQKSIVTLIVEFFISLLNQNADTYAKKLLPLFLSSDLDRYNGLMFNRDADLIETSNVFLNAQYVDDVMNASQSLVSKVLA